MSIKEVLSHFASGVTIVTTQNGEMPYGLTVSAFCAVSLEPPLVLVCINKTAGSHDVLLETRRFAVNLLTIDQKALSQRFADSNLEPWQRFDGVAYRQAVTGSPILEGCLAFLDCTVYAVYDGGDHSILVGSVVECGVENLRPPLLYYHRAYHTVAALSENPGPDTAAAD